MTETAPLETPEAPPAQPDASPAPADRPERARIDVRPVLDQLARHHPQLFGARFAPLKVGIFEDLVTRHGETFPKEVLKAALSFHARSTRYLEAVASGAQRTDLDGQPIEPVAPEHVHHAIMEVYRRRKARAPEEAERWLKTRIARALEASGLSREDYIERVHAKDDAALAAIDEAHAQGAERKARQEALRRAYAASGQTVEAFAEMYGMKPGEVKRLLA